MRIGLVTDVHNHAAELAAALRLLRDRGADRVVTIGDTLDPFARPEGEPEVAALLQEYGVEGVWGNHDVTLCLDVTDKVRARYSPDALAVMARMQPRLVIGDCHFSHREAWLDPYDIAQLWEFGDSPLNLFERASGAFAATAARLSFVGHYHRWWASTPGGTVAWTGDAPLRLDPGERYFAVVAAVFEGRCGLLDTDLGVLEPLTIR